jgi:hypothetical protein
MIWSAFKRHLTWSIFGSVVIVIIALLLSMMFTIDFGGPVSENQLYAQRQDNDGIVLVGHAFNVKTSERALQVTWYPVACGRYYDPRLSPSASNEFNGYGIARCGLPNVNVTIFVDGNTSEPAWEYDPSTIPSFDKRQNGVATAQNWFVTESQLYMYTWVFHANKHTLGLDFLYPFLNYEFTHHFMAVSNSSALSAVPILEVILVTSTDNYVPVANAGTELFTIPFEGIAEPVQVYTIKLSISLSSVARAFSIVLFAVNWGLALIVMFMTISLVVEKNRNNAQIPDSVLAMPVTIILTIPALRALFIGNPPFGNVLDVLGLLPQMIIVAVSSLVLMVVMAVDIKPKAKSGTGPSDGSGDGVTRYSSLLDEKNLSTGGRFREEGEPQLPVLNRRHDEIEEGV